MKKVMLLVLTVMLVSSFLMASGPPLRVVRLTVINKSGNEVMIKLEGSDVGKQDYYLTNPAGTKEWPTITVWTVLEDVYKRTTWYGEGDVAACVGVSSSGTLIMDQNVKLNFTPCFAKSMRTIEAGKDTPKSCIEGNPGYDKVQCKADSKEVDRYGESIYCQNNPGDCEFVSNLTKVTNAGEPTQEKVVYYSQIRVNYYTHGFKDSDVNNFAQRCGTTWLYWREYATEVPDLCQWRYGY